MPPNAARTHCWPPALLYSRARVVVVSDYSNAHSSGSRPAHSPRPRNRSAVDPVGTPARDQDRDPAHDRRGRPGRDSRGESRSPASSRLAPNRSARCDARRRRRRQSVPHRPLSARRRRGRCRNRMSVRGRTRASGQGAVGRPVPDVVRGVLGASRVALAKGDLRRAGDDGAPPAIRSGNQSEAPKGPHRRSVEDC